MLPNPGMSFSPFAILTAEEMNDLVANIESLSDGTGIIDDAITAEKIDWAAIGANAGIWWEELGRTTLASNGDSITVSGLPPRRYIRLMFRIINSGALSVNLRFNNDSGSNYAIRYFADGVGGSAVSQSVVGSSAATAPMNGYADIFNNATTVKTGKLDTIAGSNVASAAPIYIEYWFKWTNTTDAITRIDLINVGAGDFAVGSEMVVIGHN